MTDSWWVRNARDLEWTSNTMGEYCLLAADPRAAYAEYGELQKVESPL
jgi:hypothetical protein